MIASNATAIVFGGKTYFPLDKVQIPVIYKSGGLHFSLTDDLKTKISSLGDYFYFEIIADENTFYLQTNAAANASMSSNQRDGSVSSDWSNSLKTSISSFSTTDKWFWLKKSDGSAYESVQMYAYPWPN